jgi:hypothetical protein
MQEITGRAVQLTPEEKEQLEREALRQETGQRRSGGRAIRLSDREEKPNVYKSKAKKEKAKAKRKAAKRSSKQNRRH